VIELAVVGAVIVAITVPHLLPLERVSPGSAAAIWSLALALRAIAGVGAAIFVFVYLPQTALFAAVARWCMHAVVPLLAAHLGLDGHALADVAVVLPALALAVSVLWMVFGVARAAVALRVFLRRRSGGTGPHGTTIVEEDGVLVAATGLGRGQILISRAALAEMDGAELAASLAHERAHLRRGHRPLLLLARVLTSLGRLVPGTVTAERALVFALERDADECAVRETGDPLALASALCKTAGAGVRSRAMTALTGRGRVTARLELLVERRENHRSPRLDRAARRVATGMAAVAIALFVTLPGWALASPGAESGRADHSLDACDH
jgi:Zn-dependent protease with chaperone function